MTLTNFPNGIAADITGDLTGQTFGVVSTYAADGAIALTDKMAVLNGADASCVMTLAAGTAGKVTRIKANDTTETVTVTPASFVDGTTITFTPANEYVELTSDGTSWYLTGGNAAVT